MAPTCLGLVITRKNASTSTSAAEEVAGGFVSAVGPAGSAMSVAMPTMLSSENRKAPSPSIDHHASGCPPTLKTPFTRGPKRMCGTNGGLLGRAAPPGWQYLQRCTELLDMDGSGAMDQCRRIVEFIGMQGREHTKVKTYSKGMIQRFGLGAALIGNPKLLILDEPTAGLDPIGIREIRLLLESLKSQGMTIFLNSHLLSEVEKICDTAAIINRGALLVKDAISTIVRDGDTLEDVFVRLVKG